MRRILPVIEYIVPAPSVTFATPSEHFSPAHTTAAVTTGVSLDTASVVSPRCATTAVQDSPIGRVCCACVHSSPSELFVAEETTQNSVEIPTEASHIVDQSVDVLLVAAPAPANDVPVPATAFQVGEFGYDVFHGRHCETIRIGDGMYRYQIRVLFSDEDPSDWTAGESGITILWTVYEMATAGPERYKKYRALPRCCTASFVTARVTVHFGTCNREGLDEDHHWAWVLFHCHRREGDCSQRQREARELRHCFTPSLGILRYPIEHLMKDLTERVCYAAENKFERFRGFSELISRFEFEFRCCGNCFLEGFEFLVCSKFNHTQCGRTCACAVVCLCPHNSISNVVVSETTSNNIDTNSYRYRDMWTYTNMYLYMYMHMFFCTSMCIYSVILKVFWVRQRVCLDLKDGWTLLESCTRWWRLVAILSHAWTKGR